MQLIDAVVAARREEPGCVAVLELRHPRGEALPRFEPGAHIDVHLPNGLVRQYSLCNAPGDEAPDHYLLGVKREDASRGGSQAVHERLWPGQAVRLSVPRNLFRLDPAAGQHVLIAGGIGITPLLSMLAHCERTGLPWSLLYCGRSRASMAFLDALPTGPQVRVHADDEAAGLPDLERLLAGLPADAHVYCCGPSPLMDAVARTGEALGLPSSRLHFERFSAPPAPVAATALDHFEVHLARTGLTLPVGPNDSILSVLDAAGVDCPSSCQQGVCGTCRVAVLQGQPDHRDHVLSEAEREANDSLYICVSRSLSPRLVLDL